MQKGKFIKAMLAAAAVMTGGSVWAEAAETYTLDAVVVTATRTEKEDINVPASTTVITAQDIKEKGYTSVFNAVENAIGVTSNSYTGDGEWLGGSPSRLVVRGMDRAVLVLVNGAPVNIMNYATTDIVPVNAVERIEVIRGSNSVLYGAEAMGGVINIITKKGGDPGGTVSVKYGNYTKGYRVGVQGDGYIVSVERDLTDSVDVTNHAEISGTDYRLGKGNRTSLFTSLRLSDKLTVDWSHVTANKNRYAYGVTGGKRTGHIKTSGTGKWEYDSVRNNIDFVYNDEDSGFRSILAYNNRRLDTTNVTYKSDTERKGTSRGTNYNVYDITFDNQKTWSLRGGKDTLTGGLTWKREHWKLLKNPANRIGRDSYAAYASYNRQFTDKFSGIFGVRGETFRANGWDQEQNVFLPQVQFLYKMSDSWSLYTNVGKSFEMPAINSKYYSSKLKASKVKPQEGWTYEIGTKHVSGKDSFKFDVFHMDMKNKFKWVKESVLDPAGDSNTSVQINAQKFRNTGVEAEYTHTMNEHWSYDLGLSFSNPETQDSGKWTQDDARIQATAGVTYRSEKFTGNVNFLYLGDRKESYYASKYPGKVHQIPDKILLNAAFSYRPVKNQSIDVNFYNILDKDICVNEYENYALPYNWTVAYSYSF